MCWGPRLGVFVDLMECDDDEANAFFFSTSVELKTKGAGGGGAGSEMMDLNTSLPSICLKECFVQCYNINLIF